MGFEDRVAQARQQAELAAAHRRAEAARVRREAELAAQVANSQMQRLADMLALGRRIATALVSAKDAPPEHLIFDSRLITDLERQMGALPSAKYGSRRWKKESVEREGRWISYIQAHLVGAWEMKALIEYNTIDYSGEFDHVTHHSLPLLLAANGLIHHNSQIVSYFPGQEPFQDRILGVLPHLREGISPPGEFYVALDRIEQGLANLVARYDLAY